jgi:hypothetical protein
MDKINWSSLYQQLGTVTPLPVDCGKLCGSKCCTEWDNGAGVNLLPGEEKLFQGLDWCQIAPIPKIEAAFPGEHSYILQCQGKCPRHQRPLLCRTFPLAPYMEAGQAISLVFDEAGWLICPLVQLGDLRQLDPRFVRRVLAVWQQLAEDKSIKNYIIARSKEIDNSRNDPWKKLF